MKSLNPQPSFWTIAEYIAIATSVLGSLLSAISGQTLYATAPISLALLLNLLNRNQLQQDSRNDAPIENANENQLDSSLQKQTRTDSNLALTLFEVLERIEKVPEISQAINQVTQQIESLKSDFDNRSEPKEIIEIKETLTNLQISLDTKIEGNLIRTKDLVSQIRPYKYSLIYGQINTQQNDRAAIREKLIFALNNSKERLIMVCPWITTFGIDKVVLNLMDQFLRKNNDNRIDIGWGSIRNIQNTKALQPATGFKNQFWFNAIPDLKQLQTDHLGKLNLKLMGTHEKFLVCDESWALITSHNFLTSGNNSDEREIGIVTNDEVLIRALIERYDNAPDLG